MTVWRLDKFGRKQYDYSIKLLRSIADCYEEIYESGLEVGLYVETNDFRLAEYRADFSLAMKRLGRRKRMFIELLVKGYENGDLERRGFYEPERFKRICFGEMKSILNGGE